MTVSVDGVELLSHTFVDGPLNDGSVGLHAQNSVTRFDDVQVQEPASGLRGVVNLLAEVRHLPQNRPDTFTRLAQSGQPSVHFGSPFNPFGFSRPRYMASVVPIESGDDPSNEGIIDLLTAVASPTAVSLGGSIRLYG